jgi:hypothetical protein
MGKNDYTKRMGQIYALAIQKGYSEKDLLQYTENVFAYLYKKDQKKRSVKNEV